MKKPLFAALGVAIAYTGAAWYTGYMGEQKFREQLALGQQQSSSAGMQLDKVEYDRGIFSSRVELSIKPVSTLPLEQVTFKSRVTHGPLLFGRGFGVGLYDMQSEFALLLRDETVNTALQAALKDKLDNIRTRVYFDGAYDGLWELEAIEKQQDGVNLSMQPSRLGFSGKLDSLSGKGQLTVGAIKITLADGSRVEMNEMTADVSVENLEPGVNLTNMKLEMPGVNATSATGVPFAMEGLTVAQTQTLVNNKIDTHIKMDMARLVGPVVVDKAYYHIAFNQVDKAAVKAMNKSLTRAAGVTDPTALQAVYVQMFTQAMPLLLQDGLTAQLAVGAEFMGGKSEALWNIRYVPPVDGKTIAELQGMEDYLALVDSDLLVKAPAALLQASPASTMVGTYVEEENGFYLLKARFKNGELVVGNTTVPPEQWMGALTGVAALAQAGQTSADEASEPQQYVEPEVHSPDVDQSGAATEAPQAQ